ncbi:hypothetical protein [Pseudomonas viridiflava]|nr:hypothetical protein [Pseudomonas viridiflava]
MPSTSVIVPGYIDLLRVYPPFLPTATLWDIRPDICRNKPRVAVFLKPGDTLGLPD